MSDFIDTTEPSPLELLCIEYDAWNKAQGLNLGSADEHHWDESLTDAQRAYVRDFSRRWDNAADQEAAWAEAERELLS